MLILAKAAMAMMLGFILSIIAGVIIIPLMRKLHFGQRVSLTLGERHLSKDGTPTIGGLIFIIPTIITILLLWWRGSIDMTSNLIIVMIVFVAYALLGLADDLLKIIYKNNKGLSIMFKLFMQTLIALVFFYIYIRNGGEPYVAISAININIYLGWIYGLFILFLLVGTSNAVNITDGLDGLAGGLSAIAFFAYGLIAWNTSWLAGYQEIAIFCFVLVGTLLGFLFYNTHPAKIFMGDTGSLALGGIFAATGMVLKQEILLVLIGLVFVVETLSVIIQVTYYRKTKKRIFKMAPLHHHFEMCGWNETQVVHRFWLAGLICAIAGLLIGVI